MTDREKAEFVAELFHRAYTQLAPRYGWQPQEGTEGMWENLPQANRDLMVATVEHLMFEGAIVYGYGRDSQ